MQQASTYSSFSPRVGPGLIAAGGVLAVAGGLGVWVRAVQVGASRNVVTVGSVAGVGRAEGWAIAVLGAVAAVAAFAWVRARWMRSVAPVAGVAAVVLIALRIDAASSEASQMALRAGARAGRSFVAYNAGFGWGAWTMTVAAVLLALGIVVALLRLLDVRKGLVA